MACRGVGVQAAAARGIKLFALAVVLAACGRSEEIGWADREEPDSAERAARRAAATDSLESSALGEQLQTLSYQRLAQSLGPIRQQAMADPEIRASLESLASDVEAKVISVSAFHRGLIRRREEIESLIGRDAVPPDTLTGEQRAELVRHYQNIQREMNRVRNLELRSPEFLPRLRAFHAAVFEKMRELAPGRAEEIDRMEEMEEEVIATAPEPPAPDARSR